MTKSKYFFKVPVDVVNNKNFVDLKSSSKVLFLTLCHCAMQYGNTYNNFFQSVDDLRKKTGFNRKTIIKAKRELIEKKFIEIEKNYNKPDYFKIKW